MGGCGSATVRNIYAAVVPLEDLSMAFIAFTWVWEWIGFVGTILDFVYFMVKEHKCGSNMMSADEVKLSKEISADSPKSPASTSNELQSFPNN